MRIMRRMQKPLRKLRILILNKHKVRKILQQIQIWRQIMRTRTTMRMQQTNKPMNRRRTMLTLLIRVMTVVMIKLKYKLDKLRMTRAMRRQHMNNRLIMQRNRMLRTLTSKWMHRMTLINMLTPMTVTCTMTIMRLMSIIISYNSTANSACIQVFSQCDFQGKSLKACSDLG